VKTVSCDPDIVGFQLLRGVRQEKTRLQMSHISGAEFGLFWGVLVGIPWSAALKGSRVQEKDSILQTQQSCLWKLC